MSKKQNDLDKLLIGMGEDEVIAQLMIEGKKLERIAINVWKTYLASYSPREYIRTEPSQSLESIRLGKVKRTGINEFGIELTWVDDLAYHDSWITQNGGKQYPQGHSIMLISEGWGDKKKGQKGAVHRWDYYEGFNYIGIIKQAYNATRPANVTLEFDWSGKFLR